MSWALNLYPNGEKFFLKSIKIKWLCEQEKDYTPEARSLNQF